MNWLPFDDMDALALGILLGVVLGVAIVLWKLLG